MRRTLFGLLAILGVGAAPAHSADLYSIDLGHSEVAFQVRHLVTKVRGRFRDFEGNIRLDPQRPEASSVEFRIRAASIDTDLLERDNHLRSADFLDVAKYPEITFRSERVRPVGQHTYEVTGSLVLRGVSRSVTLPVRFLGFVVDPWRNEKAGFEISMALDRRDFGITWNKTLDQGGLILGDEVVVSINLETVKQKRTEY